MPTLGRWFVCTCCTYAIHMRSYCPAFFGSQPALQPQLGPLYRLDYYFELIHWSVNRPKQYVLLRYVLLLRLVPLLGTPKSFILIQYNIRTTMTYYLVSE